MVLISYDISNNKKRTKFNNYIKKYGVRLQYSVYEIENSERILKNIVEDLNNKFIKIFDETDSVYIFKLSNSCEVTKYGYAKHEDTDLLIVK
ncbi:MAG: CRISPR-associated endonuclease Cas2 [Eubacteriales bacterium]